MVLIDFCHKITEKISLSQITGHKGTVVWAILSLAFFVSAFGCKFSRKDSLQPGDLIFQRCEASAFVDAIGVATANTSFNYEHVGIFDIIDGDSVVIEATPKMGVTATPLRDFVHDAQSVTVMRISDSGISVIDALERAKAKIGMPYDWRFRAGNDSIYCSELVQECYLRSDGTNAFESVEMNFRDADGEMPEFWAKLYEELGEPIPQGEPGTNPNSIASSPLLRTVNL